MTGTKDMVGATLNLSAANSYGSCAAGEAGLCNAGIFDGYVSTGLATAITPSEDLQKVYMQAGGYTVHAPWTTFIANGGKLFVSMKPNMAMAASDDTSFRNMLTTMVNTWGTANFKICLWQEMNRAFATPAAYRTYCAHYYPIVKSVSAGIKVVYDPALTSNNPSTAITYYPGDQFCDEIAADMYATTYVNSSNNLTGVNLTNLQALADGHTAGSTSTATGVNGNGTPAPVPLGLGEWGINGNGTTQPPVATWTTFTNYLSTFFTARLTASKTNGWLVSFNSDASNVGTTDMISGPSDPHIAGWQHVYTTLASQAGGGPAGHAGLLQVALP